jgi:hypothetical protein
MLSNLVDCLGNTVMRSRSCKSISRALAATIYVRLPRVVHDVVLLSFVSCCRSRVGIGLAGMEGLTGMPGPKTRHA